MDQLSEIIKAAKDFKEKATLLVKKMCLLSDIDFIDPDRNYLLRIKYGKQKEHILDEEWVFLLHGAECRFTNTNTDQEIEVIMSHGRECGILDPYFFYKFCLTTPEYEHLAKYYEADPITIFQPLLELYTQKRLKNIRCTEDDLKRSLYA